MKIDRLIGILSILLQKEKVTAPELAQVFEVSKRTINRDIDDLCRAGIPIVTSQGTGGGISIMDGYRMDRTILSSKDMQMIMAGLRSLDSVSGSHYYGQLMEKYNNDKLADTYISLNNQINKVAGDLATLSLNNERRISTLEGQVSTLAQATNTAIAGINNTLSNITKTVVPKDAVCPEYMNRYNSWTAPTAGSGS